MKIRVVMKCPDSLEFAIDDYLSNENEDDRQNKLSEINNVVNKYFKYGEVVTLVIDTEKEICFVEEV